MDFDQELLDEFTVESLEHLESIEPLLLSLEQQGDASTDEYNSIFRALHSIKGAAGFLGLERIQSLSHVSESLLMRLRDGDQKFERSMADPLLEVVDTLRQMLEALPTPTDYPQEIYDAIQALLVGEGLAPVAVESEEGEEPAPPKPTGPRARFGEVAVDLGLLSAERVGELLAAQENLIKKRSFGALAIEMGMLDEAQTKLIAAEQTLRFAQAESQMTEAQRMPLPKAGEPAAEAASGRRADKRVETVRVSVPLLNNLIDLAGELVLSRNQLRRRLEDEELPGVRDILQRMDQITSELQESIMHTRMQPIRGVLEKLPRQVRDVSSKLNKKVELSTLGGEVEVDRSILEALSDPLTHLIRNSLDHGIETPEDRVAAGKPETGELQVIAFHESGQVIVEIKDDGRGIDGERVRNKAVERGAISEDEAAAMDDHDSIQLIFHAGLSTAEQVTDVSGRGVGMDVVRTNIQKLGGQIELESAVGVGTTVRIRLPLTLAIIPSLIVAVEGERFAIPQVNLSEVLSLPTSELDSHISVIDGISMLRLRGRLLPLMRLDTVLNIPRSELPKNVNIVVLKVDNSTVGLVVDELQDNEEIVVKPLSSFVKNCVAYSGVTILGDGAVAMILDSHGLLTTSGIELRRVAEAIRSDAAEAATSQARSIIVFANADNERFALPLAQLERLERIEATQVERVGGQDYVQYRGDSIPVFRLEQLIPCEPLAYDAQTLFVLIPRAGAGRVGLLASRVVDTLITDVEPEADSTTAPGQLGRAVLDGHLTMFLDCEALVLGTGMELEA